MLEGKIKEGISKTFHKAKYLGLAAAFAGVACVPPEAKNMQEVYDGFHVSVFMNRDGSKVVYQRGGFIFPTQVSVMCGPSICNLEEWRPGEMNLEKYRQDGIPPNDERTIHGSVSYPPPDRHFFQNEQLRSREDLLNLQEDINKYSGTWLAKRH